MKKLLLSVFFLLVLIAFATAYSKSDFVKLIENTDTCITDCYSTYLVCNPTSFNLTKTLSNLSVKFLSSQKGVTKSRVTNYSFWVNDSACEYQWVQTGWTWDNGTYAGNGSRYSFMKPFHEYKQICSEVWENILESDVYLAKGACIKLQVRGKKKWQENVDNVISFAGYDFPEYAWWNTSSTNRKAITLKDSQNATRLNEPVTVNVTGLTLQTNNCSSELRVTANYSSETELPLQVLNNSGQALAAGSQWCLIKFQINLTQFLVSNATHAVANVSNVWVYYNSAAGYNNTFESRYAWNNETNMTYFPNTTDAWTIVRSASARSAPIFSEVWTNMQNTSSGEYHFYYKYLTATTVEVRFRLSSEKFIATTADGAEVGIGAGGYGTMVKLNSTGALFVSSLGGDAAAAVYYPLADVNTTMHTYRAILNGQFATWYIDNTYVGNLSLTAYATPRINFGIDFANVDAGIVYVDYITYSMNGQYFLPLSSTLGSEETSTTGLANYSNNVTSPTSPATYSPTATYQFNVTWVDAVAIDVVRLEFNGTNYTATNSSGVSTYSIYSLPVGNYSYKWFANDTGGATNATPYLWMNVSKGTCGVHLKLNGTEGSVSQVLNATINATVYQDCGQGRNYLLINGTLAASGSGTGLISNLSYRTAVDYINYTYNYSGAPNYSDSVTTRFASLTPLPIFWNNNRTNSTAIGLTTLFSLLWQGASTNLSYYQFYYSNISFPTFAFNDSYTFSSGIGTGTQNISNISNAVDDNLSTYAFLNASKDVNGLAYQGYSEIYYNYSNSVAGAIINHTSNCTTYSPTILGGTTYCRIYVYNFDATDWDIVYEVYKDKTDIRGANGTYDNFSINASHLSPTLQTFIKIKVTGGSGAGGVASYAEMYLYNLKLGEGTATGWTPFLDLNNSWSNYSKKLSTTLNYPYYWRYEINDTNSSYHYSDTYMFNTTDYIINYSNNRTNNTIFGLPTLFSLYWNTSLTNLSYYLFSYSSNGSAFANQSWQPFSATNNTWSNYTINLPSTVNLSYSWMFYINDSAGRLFNSSVYSLNTTNYIVNITAYDEETYQLLTFNVSFFNGTDFIIYTNQTNFSNYSPLGSNQVTINNYSGGYMPRTYIISQTDNVIVAYLLKTTSSQRVTFAVKNTASAKIENALVNIYKATVTPQLLVGQAYTDGAGTATFYLNPTTTYNITIEASGYSFYSSLLTPSLTDYTIILGSSGNTTLNSSYLGIAYMLTPPAPYGMKRTATNNVTFVLLNLTSQYNDLVSWGLNISHYYTNGTQISLVTSYASTTASGGGVNVSYNVTAIKNSTFTIWWQKSGYALTKVDITYTIFDNNTGASVWKGLQAIDAANRQSPDTTSIWTRLFLPLLLAAVIGGSLSRYTLWGGGAAAIVVLLFFFVEVADPAIWFIITFASIGFFALIALYRT